MDSDIFDAVHPDIGQNVFVDYPFISNMIIADIKLCPYTLLTCTVIVTIYVWIGCFYAFASCYPALCPVDPRPVHGGPLSPPLLDGGVGLLFALRARLPSFFLGILGGCGVAASVGFLCIMPPPSVICTGWAPCRSCPGGPIGRLSMAHPYRTRVCSPCFVTNHYHGDVWGSIILCYAWSGVVYAALILSFSPLPFPSLRCCGRLRRCSSS